MYPDYGCNFETYTEPGFLELESLGTLRKLHTVKRPCTLRIGGCSKVCRQEKATTGRKKPLFPESNRLNTISHAMLKTKFSQEEPLVIRFCIFRLLGNTHSMILLI
jgi:hypothetical protein